MGTELLVLGKGDNIITMVLDNLYSNGSTSKITIYNNLQLPIESYFGHDEFEIKVVENLELEDYSSYTLGVGQPIHKIKIVQLLQPDPKKFINVIHSGFDVSKTTKLGYGLLINSKVSVAAQSFIGNFVTLNRHVSIGHHTIINDFCSINPGVNIAGTVTIGEGTLIGMGTNVIQGVKIGKNTIIGAGSVVTKNIPDNVVAYGSPCKIIRDNI
jgi:sugar O-acyltransferase (sialic acid O-acetyltransferase NeuD family)